MATKTFRPNSQLGACLVETALMVSFIILASFTLVKWVGVDTGYNFEQVVVALGGGSAGTMGIGDGLNLARSRDPRREINGDSDPTALPGY